MTIGENIRRLRRSTGLSQEELAEIAQVTNKAVSSWEIGGRTPRLSALRRIATHFNIPVSELLAADEQTAGALIVPYPQTTSDQPQIIPSLLTDWLGSVTDGTGGPSLSPAAVNQLTTAYLASDNTTRALVCRALAVPLIPVTHDDAGDSFVDVVVYNSPAAAGSPLYVESDYERLRYPTAIVPRGTDFAVRIFGDSMLPTLKSGNIVFVRKQDHVPTGEIGIFTVDGDAACKRYSKPAPGSRPLLLSDNAAYSPIDVERNDVRVLGLVLGIAE